MSGSAATIRRVASTPFIPGMLMSMSTRAGSSSAAMATASSPLVASPTRAKPSIRRTTALAAERKGA